MGQRLQGGDGYIRLVDVLCLVDMLKTTLAPIVNCELGFPDHANRVPSMLRFRSTRQKNTTARVSLVTKLQIIQTCTSSRHGPMMAASLGHKVHSLDARATSTVV